MNESYIMRLKTSHAAARDTILSQAEEGFALKRQLETQGDNEMAALDSDEFAATVQRIKVWRTKTVRALQEIFPRAYEPECFQGANIALPAQWEMKTPYDALNSWKTVMMVMLQNLEKVLARVDEYTDLPLQSRVYIEDIDSFSKARDINPERVKGFLKDGRIEIKEDSVQRAMEDIVGETFHKKDHGGEINDLSTHLRFCGKRRAATFLLKGCGESARELQISNCGKNGDQIVRLFHCRADLYVVQYVGPVSDNLVIDVEGKAEHERSRGRDVCYCIINGTDTARLLLAYKPEALPAGTGQP